MPSTSACAESSTSELVLKTIAPRAPLNLLARPRLSADDTNFRDRQISLVQAPAGYGKTSLLAQWRREYLARGIAVAWFQADERDDAQRLLLGLELAVRTGCARPSFGGTLLDGALASVGTLDGATAWLAEVAQMSLDVLVIVDEAERLPESGAQVLAYVLHNAPQNLRIVIAARRGLETAVFDLLAYGHAVLVGPEMLRFRLDETIALVAGRFGDRVDADACARLCEITDGWPLGLQFALSAMARAADVRQAIEHAATGPGRLREHLVTTLVANLSAEDNHFLVRASVTEVLHPDLCVALTGDPGARERLARLVSDTPLFVTAEHSVWCRLQGLVRDALLDRLQTLPADERAQLHQRAAAWLAAHGLIEEAARHAHAAGQHQDAYELAERCLHHAVTQGQLSAALDWLALIPEAELERRPRLRLAIAWALALGERHNEAECQVERILLASDSEPTLRYECALILSAAAYYADDPDRFLALLKPWAEAPPASASWLAQAHANRLAARAMLFDEPAQARRFQHDVPRGEVGKGLGYVIRWGDHMVGLSYLHEGQLRLAEDILVPALASAEEDLGRRHPLTCMIAATCAAIAYEGDRLDEAAGLLANRLDMLVRAATPETVALAYCTAARIAAARGKEHRALDLLEAMHALGMSRQLPRLCVVSLAEQIRMHAGRYRAQTCDALVRRIDEIVSGAVDRGPLWHKLVALPQALAQADAAIASRNWQHALDRLALAQSLADTMKMGRYRIEIMVLRAFAEHQSGADGRALLLEAQNLAQTFSAKRTLIDTHPALADWAQSLSDESTVQAFASPQIMRPSTRAPTNGPRAVPSVVLTPKEREILELLARNLTNKEIARAATVGEGTVKWHLKNLFGKLDASSRKHAVRRALMLGLLEDTV